MASSIADTPRIRASRRPPAAAWWRALVAALLMVGAGVDAAGAADAVAAVASPPALPEAIGAELQERRRQPGIISTHREELLALYSPREFRPLWLGADGQPSAVANEALSLLADAASHGLEPARYGSRPLLELGRALGGLDAPVDPSSVVRFELGLSAGLLRYLRDLHVGRVDPQAVRFRIPSRMHEHDFTAMLQAVITGGRLREAAEATAPSFAQYRKLRDALARYRGLAQDGTPAPLPPATASVRPGDAYPARDALARRLVAIGDLAAIDGAAAGAARVYDAALVDAVKRFQRRHGLAADGILGKATIAALNVPLAWRVRQIELAMERLRWLPHRDRRPFVAINIPAFRLWARDAAGDAGAALDMAVIVGRAVDMQTPVFVDEMTHLILRPYWNVPRSIVRDEILPALQRDPGYLERHHMELVQGPGDDARVVAPLPRNIALLREGTLRLRQRPGPHNALGLAKFVFPNDANVYLHGTPAPRLFARARRDFSHGCVRVEDPVALAQWALRGRPEWTRERIVAGMHGTKPVRVDLPRPVQVILFYVTATLSPADGTIHFADDIYGHDRALDRALSSLPTP